MSSETKILLIDNDYGFASDLIEFLEKKGFKTWLALSAQKAKEILQTVTPDVILIELELSDSNGIDLCQEFRKKSHLKNTFIAFQSAQSDNFIQISALNSGADDFLVKPLNSHLLLSKINSYLRRISPQSILSKNGNSQTEELVIDPEKYVVYKGAKELELPRKQFEILWLMYRNPRKVFSREDLKNEIWEDPKDVNNRTIDVHIKKLREIIGDKFIKTIKGVGYKLDNTHI
jgi:two-component system alkaline phosphatase synthesis response regulator PhoP